MLSETILPHPNYEEREAEGVPVERNGIFIRESMVHNEEAIVLIQSSLCEAID